MNKKKSLRQWAGRRLLASGVSVLLLGLTIGCSQQPTAIKSAEADAALWVTPEDTEAAGWLEACRSDFNKARAQFSALEHHKGSFPASSLLPAINALDMTLDGRLSLASILLIDGGKGQLGKAIETLNELGVTGVKIIGVAKGTTRKAGFETLYDADTGRELVLNSDSPALHLIQHIRDESHRFAITGHKQRRDKKRRTSTLEELPGIGAVRRRELLRHFGGLKDISRASVNDLAKVNGISLRLAEEIYAFFHND